MKKDIPEERIENKKMSTIKKAWASLVKAKIVEND